VCGVAVCECLCQQASEIKAFRGGNQSADGAGMPSQADALRARVRQFAVRILKFVRTLPRDPVGDTAARQLARAGTAISANYHATGRARSRAEFIAKLGIVVEEADETGHWLSVIRESDLAAGQELEWLLCESGELRAIFSASLRTARLNHAGPRRRT
jgi:four helix bundle protein